jgi:hypothetical protein
MDRTFRFEDWYQANDDWYDGYPFTPARWSLSLRRPEKSWESEKVVSIQPIRVLIPRFLFHVKPRSMDVPA